MTIKESSFNKRLREHFKLMGFKIDRIESHATSPGIPDNAWVQEAGHSGWLEIKESLRMPKRIHFQPQQALWQVDHAKHGGNCATILHIKEEDQAVFIPGRFAIKAERDLKLLMEKEPESVRLFKLKEETSWHMLCVSIALG